MARSRELSSRFRGRSVRRSTAWGIGTATAAVPGQSQGISATGAVLGLSAIAPSIEGETIIRTRGELLLVLTTASVAGAGFTGAFGIGIASSPAVAAGIGSLPTPIAEEGDENWLYHRYFSLVAGGVIDGTASTDSEQPLSSVLRVEVDSKAMRKFPDGTTVYCALEATEAGVATMNWYFNSRTLVKLP